MAHNYAVLSRPLRALLITWVMIICEAAINNGRI